MSAPLPAESERDFQAKVETLARLLGFELYHTHDSRRSPAGFPDLVMAKPGRHLFAELKSQTGRVRPEQQRWIDLLTAAGAEVYIWRPGDLQRIVRVLQGDETANA